MSLVINGIWKCLSKTASYLLSESEFEKETVQKLPSFGASCWQESIGLTVQEPKIPNKIRDMLAAPCPFWNGKTVEETHLLCLVPKGLTTDALRDRIEDSSRKSSQATASRQWSKKDEEGVEGYWILITQKVLPNTKSSSPAAQERLLTKHKYEIPTALEAATAILAAKHLGKYTLYPSRQKATRCSETSSYGGLLAVGGDPNILFATYGNNWDMNYGTAGVIRG